MDGLIHNEGDMEAMFELEALAKLGSNPPVAELNIDPPDPIEAGKIKNTMSNKARNKVRRKVHFIGNIPDHKKLT